VQPDSSTECLFRRHVSELALENPGLGIGGLLSGAGDSEVEQSNPAVPTDTR